MPAVKKSPRRGRPPVDNPADQRIFVRATKAEKAKYKRAAGRAGLSLSAWLKQLAERES